jgi:hypothetical protein
VNGKYDRNIHISKTKKIGKVWGREVIKNENKGSCLQVFFLKR